MNLINLITFLYRNYKMGQVGGKFNSLSIKKAIRKMFTLETRTEEGGSGD